MKRTGFRKKTYAEVISKQSKKRVLVPGIKKAKKTPKKSQISRLKRSLWELCKQIIRLKYGNTCYTCNKPGLSGSSWQTGHFIPSSVGGASLRYHLSNLRPQCYYCNINLGGNGSQFYKNLVERESQEYVDNLFKIKNQTTIKADEQFYEEKIADYTLLLQDLQKTS